MSTDSITIAIAEGGHVKDVGLYGAISNDLHAIEKALTKIRKAYPGAKIEICHEAGPCGIVARMSFRLILHSRWPGWTFLLLLF